MQTGFGTYFFDTRPIEFKVAQDDIKAFLSTAVSFFTPPYFFYLQSKKDAKRYLNQLPRRKQRGFRYAVSLTHNDAMAEDIVQDACMRIIQAKKEWNRGLFFTIIRNRFIDLYCHSKKLDIYSVDGPKKDTRTSDWGIKPNAETDLANTQILDSALKKLTQEQREALYLSVVEGYTAREIAQLTQTPRNTVLSHILRARKKMASLIGDQEIKTGRSHE